ncbi:MAG: hypothetical protein IMX04_02520 [Candidatus Carbobacillus altaicus]|nr:hypothetical protein [Candidatus Carbobacillus altaicus]
MWKKIQDWLIQSRKNIKTIMLPIIILYFIRTMFIPTFIDVFVLFILFLIYVGALLDWY